MPQIFESRDTVSTMVSAARIAFFSTNSRALERRNTAAHVKYISPSGVDVHCTLDRPRLALSSSKMSDNSAHATTAKSFDPECASMQCATTRMRLQRVKSSNVLVSARDMNAVNAVVTEPASVVMTSALLRENLLSACGQTRDKQH